jgi:hypothetical protein
VLRQNSLYLAWFVLHFLLIIAFSCCDTLRVIAQGPTILPVSFKGSSRRAEGIVSVALGQRLASSNPLRQALATYLQLAGIEVGYGYFAPNVPGTYKLVFELHYPDGRVKYEVPRVNSAAAALRFTGLLDQIGRTKYDALREILVKMVAQSVWSEHPQVKTVRALLGSVKLPSISEFEGGKRESYDFLYAYDFSLRDGSSEPANSKEDKH